MRWRTQARALGALMRNLWVNRGLESIIHSFEAGRRAKPDEFEDGIAELVAAYFLDKDAYSRLDIRVEGKWDPERGVPRIVLGGEVSGSLLEGDYVHDLSGIITEYHERIRGNPLAGKDIVFEFKPQSSPLATNGHAGDSGHAVAVAYRCGPDFLPYERHIAVGLRDLIDEISAHNGAVPEDIAQLSGVERLEGLAEDGKIQVEARYIGGLFDRLTDVIIAAAHDESLQVEGLRSSLERITYAYLRQQESIYGIHLGSPKVTVNGAGDWYRRYSCTAADDGSREAKPHRHAFGTYGVMTDSLTGEDPSKPDMTAAILARYIAVQVVGNGLADFARVSLTYIIGHEGFSLEINTNGTGKVSQRKLREWVQSNVRLDIAEAIEFLGLRRAELYRDFAVNSDLFHDRRYAWNSVDISY